MNEDGFEIVEKAVPTRICDRLSIRLTEEAPGPAARHLMADRGVARLAGRRNLIELASRWLGSAAVPFRATLFDKSASRSWFVAWHQDTVLPLTERNESLEWGPWTVKQGVLHARAPAWALERIVALRIHLDDSDADNGPLRVIPGSHALGVVTAEAIQSLARERPSTTCLLRIGGVLAMRPLLVHASSKSSSNRRRRVLHVEYAASLDLAPGIRLVSA